MLQSSGEEGFPVWLLGDSNPSNWEALLEMPLDPRHPARHNIWTPILDEMQDAVFRARRNRIDSTKFYVRNAIQDAKAKPARQLLVWPDTVVREVERFRTSLLNNRPQIVFSFGSFAFEFARRALGEEPIAYNMWATAPLGVQFKKRLSFFAPNTINLLPLLHVSIARGKFLSAHREFNAVEGSNYFELVGQAIASTLLKYEYDLEIWV